MKCVVELVETVANLISPCSFQVLPFILIVERTALLNDDSFLPTSAKRY